MQWIFHKEASEGWEREREKKWNGKAAKEKERVYTYIGRKRICIMFITIHWIPLLFLRQARQMNKKQKNFKLVEKKSREREQNMYIKYNPQLLFSVRSISALLCLCVSMAFITGIRLKFFFSFCHHLFLPLPTTRLCSYQQV